MTETETMTEALRSSEIQVRARCLDPKSNEASLVRMAFVQGALWQEWKEGEAICELRGQLEVAEAARDAAVALNVHYDRTRQDHRNLAKNAQEQRDDWQHEAGKLDGLCEMMQGSLEESTKRIAELIDERDGLRKIAETRMESLKTVSAQRDDLALELGWLKALRTRLHNIGTGAETTPSDNEALILGVKLIEASYAPPVRLGGGGGVLAGDDNGESKSAAQKANVRICDGGPVARSNGD